MKNNYCKKGWYKFNSINKKSLNNDQNIGPHDKDIKLFFHDDKLSVNGKIIKNQNKYKNLKSSELCIQPNNILNWKGIHNCLDNKSTLIQSSDGIMYCLPKKKKRKRKKIYN